jgi:hypothetical protein
MRRGPIIIDTPEAAMNHAASTTSLPTTILQKLARLGRFMVFLCTSGWLFPHACTEGMNLTQLQNDQMDKPL